ncbi:DUF397 domain-containing protein [Micromonospora sp. NPDC048830]|uniref:DUF397 domain-containing protein n=1 Tax=Micromonospora sp. NPDC048830 TaxID=3364257 RepID=UPI0037233703
MWRTSSRSGGEGNCVEVAAFADTIGVRDSKDRGGPALSFTSAAWVGFVQATRSEDFGSRR